MLTLLTTGFNDRFPINILKVSHYLLLFCPLSAVLSSSDGLNWGQNNSSKSSLSDNILDFSVAYIRRECEIQN